MPRPSVLPCARKTVHPRQLFWGGVAAELGGGGTQTDTDVLFEFIQSQDMVARLNARFDLVGHYARYWDQDPVLALWPDATIEDLVWYWGRIDRKSVV